MSSDTAMTANTRSLGQKLRNYIALNMLAMIGTSCYILADTFFIAQAEGADGITALNLVLPLYSLIFAIGSMIGTGSATRYSIVKAWRSENANLYFSNAIFFTLLASIPFILAGILCPAAIIRFMGADARIETVGKGYTSIFLTFTPFFMLNYTFTAFVRNDEAPALAMAGTLISSFANIVLDYVFMFPMKLGMNGAALATAASPVITIAICSLHFCSKKNTIRFCRQLPSIKRLLTSCQLGISAFVGEISSGITTTVFNFLLLRLVGNVGVAAYGVAANLALVGVALFNGTAQGVQPLASEAYGKNDTAAKKQILKLAMLTTAIASIVVTVLVTSFAAPLVAVFNSEHSAQMASYAIPGVRLYFLGFLFAGINIVGTGYLSATAKAREAFLIAILRGLIAITGFAFLLSALLGVNGVWLSFPAAEGVCLILTIFTLKKTA